MRDKIKTAISNEYSNLGLGTKTIEGAVNFLEPSITAETTDEQLITAVKGIGGLLKSFQSEADVIRNAKSMAEKKALELEERLKTNTTPQPTPSQSPVITSTGLTAEDVERIISEKLGVVTTVKTELEAIKAREVSERRNSFIINEATRLGVPQTRIDEGFVFEENADDAAITAKLSVIANNVKAMSAPVVKASVPITATGHVLTDEKRAELDRKYKR